MDSAEAKEWFEYSKCEEKDKGGKLPSAPTLTLFRGWRVSGDSRKTGWRFRVQNGTYRLELLRNTQS